MIRTIFFDFGNVVAHFDHGRAIAKLRQYTDIQRGELELALALYGNPLEDEYERGRITTAEYVRLAKLAGRLDCSDEIFLAAFVDIFTANAEVCELIPRLKPRYRLALASNTNEAHYAKFTSQFAEVLSHFDALCPSFHAGHRKPEASYFAYCQRFAKAEPKECLFIDDLAVNVEAAARHGWRTIRYMPGGNLEGQLSELGVQFDRK